MEAPVHARDAKASHPSIDDALIPVDLALCELTAPGHGGQRLSPPLVAALQQALLRSQAVRVARSLEVNADRLGEHLRALRLSLSGAHQMARRSGRCSADLGATLAMLLRAVELSERTLKRQAEPKP